MSLHGSRRARVAVVGSGAAGLVAAVRLADVADVDVYEAAPRAGGHVQAVRVPSRDCLVDVAFIAWSPQLYPRAAALFEELGLASERVDFPVFVWDRGRGELHALADFPNRCGRDLDARAGRDLRRFVALLHRRAPPAMGAPSPTLGDLVAEQGYHPDLVEHLIVPALVATWGFQPDQVLAMSAEAALTLMRRTLFLEGGVEYRRLVPSTEPYRRALLGRLQRPVRTATPVRRVAGDGEGVHVVSSAGVEHYDRIVIATGARQALSMLDAPSDAQRRLLAGLGVHPTCAVVHEDDRWLPAGCAGRPAFVTTWMDGPPGRRRCCATWNMSAFCGLPHDPPLLVTVGDRGVAGAIDAARTHAVVPFEHLSLAPAYAEAHRLRDLLDEPGRVFFAGAWLGPVGSHECAVETGLRAAERLRESL